VFVLVADLMTPLAEDYIAKNTQVNVSGDMGRTLTVNFTSSKNSCVLNVAFFICHL